ncbi:MAG: bacteriochlorophyll 4-vinyl reductase [Roseiflexaceae bacterium]
MIGPNAIIQTVAALERLHSPAQAAELCRHAGHSEYITRLPVELVDEQDFCDLVGALFADYPRAEALRVLRRSGEQTGEYILRNRIPRPLALLLPRLPRALSLRLLLPAIRAHAWTFAGTGRFAYRLGRAPVLTLSECVACRGLHASEPLCDYYCGAFETLLRALIDPRIRIRETACIAQGAAECRFAVE